MTERIDELTINGAVPAARQATQAPGPKRADKVVAPTAVRTMRILTANVQSFPQDAMSLAQAREDLHRNAAAGDLVLLQEIDDRYRRLVAEEFPDTEWHVFYGHDNNKSPIAARKDIFELRGKQVRQIHTALEGVHGPRFLTHVHLRHRQLGVELHATNVHLTPGAFSPSLSPAEAVVRQAEWRDGMRTHDDFIRGLVATGAPVVGGGDYNRPLRGIKSEPAIELRPRKAVFAVNVDSIDLLWFVDGDSASWEQGDQVTFRGRDGRPRQRNSDHAARQATVALRAAVSADVLSTVLTDATALAQPEPEKGPGKVKKDKGNKATKRPQDTRPAKDTSSFEPQPQAARSTAVAGLAAGFTGPPDRPFELTTFGDIRPKVVDWKTRAALEEAERRLGYRLTVVQGSYNNGRVEASGPTHDGGGVVDLQPFDRKNKVRVLREIGFAAWFRPKCPDWEDHIHAVLINHGRLDPSAAAQVTSYRAGGDGLKGNLRDDVPRPNPIPVFHYPPRNVTPEPGSGSSARARSSAARLGPAFPPVRTLDGVDTSHHQPGRFDLAAAKRAGVRWWYAKATEGATLEDKTYKKRVRQARAAGLPIGAYHFARPEGGDARAEALYFLRHVDFKAGDMIPMLDLEDAGGLSTRELTDWVGVWVRTVTQEIRRSGLDGGPIIYTKFNLNKGFGCFLWVPRYSNDFREPVIPRPWVRAAIWQHGNGKIGPIKKVPGFGHVDVNALHPEVPLSALRLRPPRPKKKREKVKLGTPLATLETTPIDESGPETTVAPEVVDTSVVQPVKGNANGSPTISTTTRAGTTTEPGTMTITITVPLPTTPAPLIVTPDLGALEQQLALAQDNLQGAIEALPERSEP